ncbi:MAG: hypothetical protein ACRDQZ_24845 [Mycobacteriales bacterium]
MTNQPRTPANFTGTRRSENPDGGYALLRYVGGVVVEIVLHDADGHVVQRVYADEGAMRTVHAQTRFVWEPGDVTITPAEGDEH